MLACLADTNRTVQVPHVSPIRLLGTESRIDASNLRGIHVVIHAKRTSSVASLMTILGVFYRNWRTPTVRGELWRSARVATSGSKWFVTLRASLKPNFI